MKSRTAEEHGPTMDRSRIGRSTKTGKPKARTSNACEACKRRKTKCSGLPSPCNICKRADTYCNFNPKLDTRRKVAYSSTTIQDRQQFMITGLLKTIKYAPEEELANLISLVRGSSRPDAIADCLQKHFGVLQSKGLLSTMAIDDTDVISFGLQALCGHRKGRPRPTSPGHEADSFSQRETSCSSSDAVESSPEVEGYDCEDEHALGGPPSFTIMDDETFEPGDLGELDSASMFNAAVNSSQQQLPQFDGLRPLTYQQQRPGSDRHHSDHSAGNGSDATFNSFPTDASSLSADHSGAYSSWPTDPMVDQSPMSAALNQLAWGTNQPMSGVPSYGALPYTRGPQWPSSCIATSALKTPVQSTNLDSLHYDFPLKSQT